MMDESEITSVTEHFELTEADISQQVSDCHVEEISDSFCEKWRSLPPYLEMEAIVAKDIDRDHPGEECEKRCSFLKKWKKMRGLKATYKSLVRALLKAKSREEAEGVCKLLKKSISTPHQPDSSEGLATEKKIDTKGACTSRQNTTLLKYHPISLSDRYYVEPCYCLRFWQYSPQLLHVVLIIFMLEMNETLG